MFFNVSRVLSCQVDSLASAKFLPSQSAWVDSCWVLMKFLPTPVAVGDIPVHFLSEMEFGKVAMIDGAVTVVEEKAEGK